MMKKLKIRSTLFIEYLLLMHEWILSYPLRYMWIMQ